HQIIWIMWQDPFRGVVFSAVGGFLWLMNFYHRKRKGPFAQRVKFLWMAIFYSGLPFLFTIKNHKIVWLFSQRSNVALSIGAGAVIHCGLLFYRAWQARRTSPCSPGYGFVVSSPILATVSPFFMEGTPQM